MDTSFLCFALILERVSDGEEVGWSQFGERHPQTREEEGGDPGGGVLESPVASRTGA